MGTGARILNVSVRCGGCGSGARRWGGLGRARGRGLALAVMVMACGVAAVGVGGCSGSKRRQSAVTAENHPDARVAEADRLVKQALDAETAGRKDDALSLYVQAIDTWPGLAIAWNNYGLLLLERGEYADAVTAFQEAANLEPSDPRPVTHIGLAYWETGWAAQALEYFDRALTINPQYLPALRGAVRAADRVQRADERDIERIRQALLLEDDAAWRAFFERQRYVFESRSRLQEERRAKGLEDRTTPTGGGAGSGSGSGSGSGDPAERLPELEPSGGVSDGGRRSSQTGASGLPVSVTPPGGWGR